MNTFEVALLGTIFLTVAAGVLGASWLLQRPRNPTEK